MENKDIRYLDTKTPEESLALFNEFAEKLQQYTDIGAESKIAIEITDEKAKALWKKHIKPLSDQLKPLIDEMIALDEKRAEYEKEVKAHFEKMDDVKSQIDAINLKRNKFITRISPIIIREYGNLLNKYQQFGSIIEDNGMVFATVQDKLASFVSGFNKLKEQHEEKVGSKISPKMMTEE